MQRLLKIDDKSHIFEDYREEDLVSVKVNLRLPIKYSVSKNIKESKERQVGPDKSSPVFNLNPILINQSLPIELRNPEPKTNIYEENLVIGREMILMQLASIDKPLSCCFDWRKGTWKSSVAVIHYEANKSVLNHLVD